MNYSDQSIIIYTWEIVWNNCFETNGLPIDFWGILKLYNVIHLVFEMYNNQSYKVLVKKKKNRKKSKIFKNTLNYNLNV